MIRISRSDLSFEKEGAAAYAMAGELFPICRSITGDGLRQSLAILQKLVPLEIHETPSGTRVFDWTVPREWNIRDAYIKNEAGERIVDFRLNNLHLLNYSIPVAGTFSLEELRPHLYSLPEMPELIPYRTSYFNENWGFCMRHSDLEKLREGLYEVLIDSSLQPGHLSYGEYFIKGESRDEVLISCHSCHPSLCNDNLSGMTVAARLASFLARCSLRYGYRFVWAPGTVGAITWLAQNEERLDRIKHGLVLSCLGDSGNFTYKKSRDGAADIDRVAGYVLGAQARIVDFEPYGYDERQYCSPGINLPMGCLMRTPHGKYPEYHTSADDLSLISPAALGESLATLLQIITVLEGNRCYRNLNPKCEPQLGRRGLYRQMGGVKDAEKMEMALLWVLNQSDGEKDLLEIARRSRIDFKLIAEAAGMLEQTGLLEEVDYGK